MSDISQSETLDQDAEDALFFALGRATGYWAFLENRLSSWFALLSGVPGATANDIFFTPQSFAGRADLVQVAIEHSTAPEQSRVFIVAALLKVRTYSQFRNRFVHGGIPTIDVSKQPRIPRIPNTYGSLVRDTLSSGITAGDLMCAAKNFAILGALMTSAEFEHDLNQNPDPPPLDRTPLPELLRRVEQLPNEPWLDKPSQRQLGRERQLQAAQKTPIQKRSGGKGH